MIQFGILGPLEVLVDGEPIALGGPRQRAVLARLLLDSARVVSAERLIDDVWDDGHDERAATLIAAAAALRERTGSVASAAEAKICAETLDTAGSGSVPSASTSATSAGG